MASEWERLKFSEVCSEIVDCVNKTAPIVAGLTPFRMIRVTNIRDGRLDLSGCNHVDKKTFEKWTRRSVPRRGDVLLTREAPLGEVAIIKDEAGVFLGQRIMQFRANPDLLDPRFLYYSLLGNDLQGQIHSHSGTGSTVDHIRVPDCSNFTILSPSLDEQRRIANLLWCIDERIDSLRNACKSLEEIARAIFKSWFVDFDPVQAKAEGREPDGMDPATAALFPSELAGSGSRLIPAGWSEGAFGDVCEVAKVGAQKADMLPDENYVGLEHIPRESWALPSWGRAADLQSGKSRFQKGDILFGKLRPYFHKVSIAPIDGVCSTDILIVRACAPEWLAFVLCHLSSREVVDYATRLSNGAKMPRTSWQDLKVYKLVIPPESLAESFTSLVRPIIEKIVANVHAAAGLAELRDTLLPRLISGKLRVPEAEKQLEAVL